MNTAVQPILCCIGQAVAGQPTQFLMERAFAQLQLDWRVITVEVSEQDFEVALNGIRAMKFAAIRFFPESTLAAARIFAAETQPTSALYQAGQWVTWNHSAPSLIELLQLNCDFPNSLCWLHGAKTSFNHLLEQLTHELARINQRSLWTCSVTLSNNASSTPRDDSEAPGGLPNMDIQDRVTSPSEPQPIGDFATIQERLDRFFETTGATSEIVLIGDQLNERAEFLRQVGRPVRTVLVPQGNQQANSTTNDAVAVISQLDQMVAAEAYDFRRWTNREIDKNFLREALEEYVDF